MEIIRVYELITTPYIEERPHSVWHASSEDAMAAFENWADAVAADGKVQECTYEVRLRDLASMKDLLDALNNVIPDGIGAQGEADAWGEFLGKPSENAVRVSLDGSPP